MSATNDQRAAWARVALDVFMGATGSDEEDAICDLVCDLCHLAAQMKQDPFNEITRGIRHFMDERDYPPDGWAPEDRLPVVSIETWRGEGER